ncbi:MAG: GNAT family N-acetyltransferase [Fuerstiella sp.]|nr:GNAT family N-acetyltransferase [Fuerstiella sp.]MCP4854421.1 GNAT family N-acetyltransferase [Fuerstiella sp.]
MKTSVLPIAELSEHQIASWIKLLPNNGVLDCPCMRPEYALFAGRVLPNIEVAILSADGSDVGFFPFERHTGDLGLPIGRFLSELHGVVAAKDTIWDADELIRECGLKAWQFDHLIAEQEPFQQHHSFTDDSFYMDLNDGFESYCADRKSAGSSVIKQAARKERKLEREVGPVRVAAHTTEKSAWNALAEWKSAQLLRLGYSDMFRLDWVNALLEELRPVDEDEFGPLLSTLHAGDELVAVQLGLRSPTAATSWIPTFDHDYAKYSPGLILQLKLADWAANEGIHRFDLGRGENQTKLSLASDAFDIAVGSVDHRFVRRTLTQTYYGLRNWVHASPFKNVSLKAVRRIKALAGK